MLELINDLFQPGDTIYDGKYYQMPQTDFVPKPAQKPRPPFLIGAGAGTNRALVEAPLRRAARWDGYYGVPSSPANARETMDIIDGYRAELGRENEPFEYVMVFHQAGEMPAPTPSDLEGYFAVGVDRIVVTPWGFDYDNALPNIEKFAKEFGLGS
jgi:alkanesulfonate monooxygenase SsuD/methylene tetrahydromethanopterin reductase-like flavin-dependent oxidoreductase (luciferase family)